jgi:putative glutamine amidotransferase
MWWFYWLSLRLFKARAVRLLAPLRDASIGQFDGLIIGGGDHIGTEHYNGKPMPGVRIDRDRDRLELKLLRDAIPSGMPVLGVCRGAQMLNIAQGGALHQNVRAHFPKMPRMWTPLPRKRVRLSKGSRLISILGPEELRVNSLHRQAVSRLGENLVVGARDEFGVIQAIEDPAGSFRIGVQWHPEFLVYKRRHRNLFRVFVRAARQYAEMRQRAHSVSAGQPAKKSL